MISAASPEQDNRQQPEDGSAIVRWRRVRGCWRRAGDRYNSGKSGDTGIRRRQLRT